MLIPKITGTMIRAGRVFAHLSQDELAHIVDLQLALLEKRLAVRRISIEVSEAARRWLAETGYVGPEPGDRIPLGAK